MKVTIKTIYCCGCKTKVEARLTNGSEIYPHRYDIHHLPFWKCDTCNNYVGCHYKTNNPTHPLGFIPTKELKDARKHIHKILDPIWQKGSITRGALYRAISDKIGRKYHTANIRTIEEARKVYRIVRDIALTNQ